MNRLAAIAGIAIALTLGSFAVPRVRPLVWNVSASVPTGFYVIRGRAGPSEAQWRDLHVGERVALEPPPELRRLLAERGYLPLGVPLLKRVAAVAGQRVCRFAHGVTIDGELVALARLRDSRGRLLPSWAGCHKVARGEVFVLSPASPDSFDGRYFGMLALANVTGRAMPVWTDEAGNGRHVWFAEPNRSAIFHLHEGD